MFNAYPDSFAAASPASGDGLTAIASGLDGATAMAGRVLAGFSGGDEIGFSTPIEYDGKRRRRYGVFTPFPD
jgi:hypothetical protein